MQLVCVQAEHSLRLSLHAEQIKHVNKLRVDSVGTFSLFEKENITFDSTDILKFPILKKRNL
jgi:hypothetical protein